MGSIVTSAQISNVIDFKPIRNFIGPDSAVPISKRQNVIVILTRSDNDAAYILNNTAGRSELDPTTWQILFEPVPEILLIAKAQIYEVSP